MERIDEKIAAILASIPDQPTEFLPISQRQVVQEVRNDASRDWETDFNPDNIRLLSFENDLRGNYHPSLTFYLHQPIHIDDFLLDFIEAAAAMGINDPPFCRAQLDRVEGVEVEMAQAAGDLEPETCPYADELWQKWEESKSRRTKDRIVYALPEGELVLHHAEMISYPDIFYEAEVDQTQTSVKLMPTTNLIGQVSPTLVLEAYLLHLLDREKIYVASETAQSI